MLDAKKFLSLSAMWKVAVPIAPSFSNIPDGDYVGDIKEMKLGESKAGNVQVVITLEVMDHENADLVGKTVKRFDGIGEETGMGYFKNTCEVIGLDLPEKSLQWQAAMDAFVADTTRVDLYDFTVKTNTGRTGGSFLNVYINGISELTKGGEEVVEEETVEEIAPEEAATEEEVVVEEEIPQEVIAPTRRVVAKAPTKVALTKVPVKAAVAAPIKRVASVKVEAATPMRRVALRK